VDAEVSNLEVFAASEEEAVHKWHEDIVNQGYLIYSSKIISNLLFNYLQDKSNSSLEEDVNDYLRAQSKDKNIITGFLTNTDFKTVFNYKGNHFQLSGSSTELFKQAKFTEHVYLSQPLLDIATNTPYQELVIAITNHGRKNSKIYGYLVLIVNLREGLFKQLNKYNVARSSYESILLRKKRDELIYINDVKYVPSYALRLSTRIGAEEIPGKRLSHYEKGTITGIDYRGETVVAYISYLSKLDWYLVVKVDKREILTETNKVFYISAGSVVLALILFGIIFGTIWRKERFEQLQKELELQLDRAILAHKYATLSKLANDAIILIDENLRIVEANDKAFEMYGFTPVELERLPLISIHAMEVRSSVDETVKKIKLDNGYIYETIHINNRGDSFYVEVSAKFVNINGKEYLMEICRNVEERKRIEQELRAAKSKAEESDQLKSNFLSMISHEVRTPLNIILGVVDILDSSVTKELLPSRDNLFDMVGRNSKRLINLISDMIDISRVQSNDLSFNYNIRNAETILLDIKAGFEHDARMKGLQIIEKFNAPNGFIRIDEERFYKVMSNIILNAIKFTQRGGITLITEIVKDKLHISVKDTGIGIAPNFKEHLFKFFRQAEEGYGRSFEGAGLGLAISKRFLDMMGGKLEVQSEVNVGSTFTVILPRVHTPYLSESQTEKVFGKIEKSNSMKPYVLIIDNDKDSLFSMEIIMSKLGVDYHSVAAESNAFQVLKNNKVDTILINTCPNNKINPEKVVEIIRNEFNLIDLPIIAVSDALANGGRERLLACGFSSIIYKPFTIETLSKVLYDFTRKESVYY
jgi:PAS domain S-box-containing protein